MDDDQNYPAVSIGNVGGSIEGSIFAGRDVKNATINLGGEETPVDQEPSFDQLQQLLADIRRELGEVTAQKQALEQVSVAAPYTAQGVQKSVQVAATKVQPDMDQDSARTVQQSLIEATGLLNGILDGAKSAAEKADAVAESVRPLAEKLEPLVAKVGTATLWVARLWLVG